MVMCHREVSYSFMKDVFIPDWHLLNSWGPGTPLSSRQGPLRWEQCRIHNLLSAPRGSAQKSFSSLTGYITAKSSTWPRWKTWMHAPLISPPLKKKSSKIISTLEWKICIPSGRLEKNVRPCSWSLAALPPTWWAAYSIVPSERLFQPVPPPNSTSKIICELITVSITFRFNLGHTLKIYWCAVMEPKLSLSSDLSTINQCKQTAPQVLAPRLPDGQNKSAPSNTFLNVPNICDSLQGRHPVV